MRVGIALDDGPLEPDPTWTYIDTDVRVQGIELNVGKQDERDETQTATVTISIADLEGHFDKGNVSSPYYQKLDGKQFQIQLYNPVLADWVPRFRGLIDDFGYDLHPSQFVSDVQITGVGFFDYLARLELLPGVHGITPTPNGSEGNVVYPFQQVDARFDAIMSDVGIDPDMYVSFSGNVNVQPTLYDHGDSALSALRDCVDAEFPGLANVYEDRFGRIVFHGRRAITDPEGTIADGGPVPTNIWDFTAWKLGDGDAVLADDDRVHVRPPFRWRSGRANIVNSAIATPQDVAETAIPSLVVQDAGSIADYGVHSKSWSNLITHSHKSNGDSAIDQCILFATAWIENLKEPRTRIDALTVKSINPDDPRPNAAANVWDFLTRADISDAVDLLVGLPGGGTIGEDFYIQGYRMTISPANPDYDHVEMQLNVSPAWAIDVFEGA